MLALSAEKLISDRMKRMDLKASALAAITRELDHYVPETTISRALNGIKDLDNETGVFLSGVLKDLENLIQAAYPVPLSMKNPAILARLIVDIKNCPRDLPTLADLLLVYEILSGQDLKSLAEHRSILLPELGETVSKIGIKLGRAASRLTEIIEEENVNP
jgi:hypothetical protein